MQSVFSLYKNEQIDVISLCYCQTAGELGSQIKGKKFICAG